jgi:hypothetical protein
VEFRARPVPSRNILLKPHSVAGSVTGGGIKQRDQQQQ